MLAAIREHMAQLTVVRSTFRRVPVAVEIDPHYSDQVWIEDSRFEDVSTAIVHVSNEKSPDTQIGIHNATMATFLSLSVLGDIALAITPTIYGVIMLVNAFALVRIFRSRQPVEAKA